MTPQDIDNDTRDRGTPPHLAWGFVLWFSGLFAIVIGPGFALVGLLFRGDESPGDAILGGVWRGLFAFAALVIVGLGMRHREQARQRRSRSN